MAFFSPAASCAACGQEGDQLGGEAVGRFDVRDMRRVEFDVARAGGLLPYVLPELAEGIGIEQNEFHAFDVYRHALATVDATPPGEVLLRIAALLHDVGKPRTKEGPHFYRHEIVGAEMVHGLLTRLRFPTQTIGRTTPWAWRCCRSAWNRRSGTMQGPRARR